jgi:hypothetical protein
MRGWRFLQAVIGSMIAVAMLSPVDAAASLRQQGVSGDFVYRFDRPVTGNGFIDLAWSDVFGRVVEQRRIAFTLTRQQAIPLHLDLRRAITVSNSLRVRVTVDERTRSGTVSRHDETVMPFAVRPSQDPWFDYNAILWQSFNATQGAAARDLGITAGMTMVPDKEHPAHSLADTTSVFLACGLGWYVENIATDFYSAYHRWSPDHPVNWRFAEIKRVYDKDPQDLFAFLRAPSLSDTHWQNIITARLKRIVRAHRDFRPLYYNLGDETGIADLSAFWDFDFSPASLAGMRRWLHTRYGTLGALNKQWGSDFKTWAAVLPMTTAQAMARTDENYSSWADFKEWMDIAFARAVGRGRDAVHAVDAGAYAGIEGAQVPGWGGYDYARLAHAVDLMEFYDDGGNVEIARDLNPKLAILTTSSESGAREVRALWRELLRGSHGVIFWDPSSKIVSAEGKLGERGQALAAPLHDIRSGLGTLLTHSVRQKDRIAILYSPASMRTQWMLDWRAKGDAWSRRDVESVYEDESAVRSSMARFFALMAHGGWEPYVVVAKSIEQGALSQDGIRILILPRALSLSGREAAAIRRFVSAGGTVIADGEPGLFDEHSRRQATPLLADLFPAVTGGAPTSVQVGRGKSVYVDPDADTATEQVRQIFAEAGLGPTINIRNKSGGTVRDIEIYRWRHGDTLILGLQRDPIDPQPGANSTPLPEAESVIVTLPRSFDAYDLRERRPLGSGDTLELEVGAVVPRLIALSTRPRAAPVLAGPARIALGDTAAVTLRAPTPARDLLLHIDVIDPSGRTVPYYSGNMLLATGKGSKRLPFALNDAAGIWRIEARDILSGAAASWKIDAVKR